MLHILEVPERIVAGWGSISTIGSEVKRLGRKAMVLHSTRLVGSDLIKSVIQSIKGQGLEVVCEEVASGEPKVAQVELIINKVIEAQCDFIIGIGGGSILDLAKAVAGLSFANRKPVKDYFYGEKIAEKGIPWVSVPTTSGAGAEATPNAVLSDEDKMKLSIRGDRSWLAQVVIVDPELTVSTPKNITAWSGMDALTQAIESHVSIGANVLTEPYSYKAIELIASSIVQAYEEPENQQARTDMAYGSLLAGIALANARLGIVHGVAHSIGLQYNIPHGLVCGTLLPWAIEYNKDVCAGKFKELADAIQVGNSTEDLVGWIRKVNERFNIPYSIKSFGVQLEDLQRIVEESMPSGSLKANPRATSEDDLYHFLAKQL